MDDINRINANFRGLVVHNKDNNVLEMQQNGNFSLTTKNIENVSYNRLVNISENDSIYKSKKKDILLTAEKGSIVLRSGKDTDTAKYEFSNPSYDIDDDTFFDTTNSNEIIKPFSSTSEVNDLRKDSFLIESLASKSMCLYSNNGLHQVSHGNINMVGDANILLQASQKLNLTSMGYILLNSERMIASIEEDINMLSSTGEFKVGGDGITTIGIKVNSNLYKNFLSIGKVDEKADRNLHININEQSYDNTKKNGIIIDSKNIENNNTFPDIELNNYDKSNLTNNSNVLTKLNMGIGSDSNDINNLIYLKKENVDGITYLVPLNNFKFTKNDINRVVTYVDTTLGSDTITKFINDSKVQISVIYTASQINTFGYQQSYLNRDNHGHVKTKTNSDLHLGTNNNDILTITNTGNLGINTVNPIASVQIENNFGLVGNIRIDKTKTYLNGRGIQMRSGNYLVFYNTFKNSLYNLECSIYNINNDFISNFIIKTGSSSYIEYDIDNLKGPLDKVVIIYCYYNNANYITETNIYNQSGIKDNINYKLTHGNLTSNCQPKVKSFELVANVTTGEMYNGYVIVYRDQTSSGDVNIYLSYFSNNSSSVIGTFNLITELDTYFTNNISDISNIISKNFKYLDIEYHNNILTFIPSGEVNVTLLNNSTIKYYYTLLNKISVTYDSNTVKPKFTTNGTFIRIGDIITINDLTRFEILGVNITLLDTSGNHILSYYIKDNSSNKITLIYRESYNSIILSDATLLETLDETISSSNYRLVNIPNISIINSSDYIISYIKSSAIRYYQSDTTLTKDLTGYSNANQPSTLRIVDANNIFQSTILLWNNEDTSNSYNYQSINFKEIIAISSFVNIKNENTNINIKNSGDITIDNIMDISKINNTTTFHNFLVKNLSEDPTSSTPGINGELKYFGTNLYIYLGQWKKVTLENV